MSRSVFCLCPPGRVSWTPRAFEAITYGCIPVFLSDPYHRPFEDKVSYSTFSIRIPEKHLPLLGDILTAAANDTAAIRMKQEALKHIYHTFVYEEPVPQHHGLFQIVMQMLRSKASMQGFVQKKSYSAARYRILSEKEARSLRTVHTSTLHAQRLCFPRNVTMDVENIFLKNTTLRTVHLPARITPPLRRRMDGHLVMTYSPGMHRTQLPSVIQRALATLRTEASLTTWQPEQRWKERIQLELSGLAYADAVIDAALDLAAEKAFPATPDGNRTAVYILTDHPSREVDLLELGVGVTVPKAALLHDEMLDWPVPLAEANALPPPMVWRDARTVAVPGSFGREMEGLSLQTVQKVTQP